MLTLECVLSVLGKIDLYKQEGVVYEKISDQQTYAQTIIHFIARMNSYAPSSFYLRYLYTKSTTVSND